MYTTLFSYTTAHLAVFLRFAPFLRSPSIVHELVHDFCAAQDFNVPIATEDSTADLRHRLRARETLATPVQSTTARRSVAVQGWIAPKDSTPANRAAVTPEAGSGIMDVVLEDPSTHSRGSSASKESTAALPQTVASGASSSTVVITSDETMKDLQAALHDVDEASYLPPVDNRTAERVGETVNVHDTGTPLEGAPIVDVVDDDGHGSAASPTDHTEEPHVWSLPDSREKVRVLCEGSRNAAPERTVVDLN